MISKDECLQIFNQVKSKDKIDWRIVSDEPDDIHIFGNYKDCWFVKYSPNFEKNIVQLVSSNVMVISKESGDVLYDGSAHDEG